MSKKETLADKAKKAGLPVQVVYNRRHAGWSEKKALSVPLREYKKKEISYKVEPKKVQTSAAEVNPEKEKGHLLYHYLWKSMKHLRVIHLYIYQLY